jgi:hypothetical protein
VPRWLEWRRLWTRTKSLRRRLSKFRLNKETLRRLKAPTGELSMSELERVHGGAAAKTEFCAAAGNAKGENT